MSQDNTNFTYIWHRRLIHIGNKNERNSILMDFESFDFELIDACETFPKDD
jgi:hypothetical protein